MENFPNITEDRKNKIIKIYERKGFEVTFDTEFLLLKKNGFTVRMPLDLYDF